MEKYERAIKILEEARKKVTAHDNGRGLEELDRDLLNLRVAQHQEREQREGRKSN